MWLLTFVPNPTPVGLPLPWCSGPSSLTLTLTLLPFLLPAQSFLFRSSLLGGEPSDPRLLPSSHSPSPSPSPSLSLPPSPSATTAPPRHHSPPAYGANYFPPSPRSADGRALNSGEKVGLAFLAVALALQVVLGGFLIYKRRQMWKVGLRLDRVPSSPPRTSAVAAT